MEILVYGSLNLDNTYALDHIVEEGETIICDSRSTFCGGKGLNQAVALAKAGANVWLAGQIGPDGQVLREECKKYGINDTFLKTVDEVTGHAIIQVDVNGKNSIIVFGGANQRQERETITEVLSHFSKGDILVLQNEINLLDYVIEEAYRREMYIVLNPSPFNAKVGECDLGKISLFVLNEIEGRQIIGETDPGKIMNVMRRKFPAADVLLTLGEQGAVYQGKDGKIYYQPAISVEAVDTTSAGDTFSGYFVAGMVRHLSVEKCLELAARASAYTVSHRGAAASIPFLQDLKKSSE